VSDPHKPLPQGSQPTYELHSLGWKAFQQLCDSIAGEIWGQVVQGFFDSIAAITLFPDFARAGGLLAYGPNLLNLIRQLGVMRGKVLQGTKPADLPIERPQQI
jgi:ABC-type uncharacterized transport system substrate-binding protein